LKTGPLKIGDDSGMIVAVAPESLTRAAKPLDRSLAWA
jgi:hypothetical protein